MQSTYEEEEMGSNEEYDLAKFFPSVLCESDWSSTERVILDISTKKFQSITNPRFKDANCVSSKDGWLLFVNVHPSNYACRLPFLVNPSTGDQIDMPELTFGPKIGCPLYSLSVVSGTPSYVVCVINNPRGMTLYVASPQAQVGHVWESYKFGAYDRHTQICTCVTLESRHQVLCLGYNGEVIAFDLLDLSWTHNSQLRLRTLNSCVWYFESGGEVLRVNALRPFFSSFVFYKLHMEDDRTTMTWVELDQSELENTSWFMGGSSFRVKGYQQGKKLYVLKPNSYGGPNGPDFETAKRKTVYHGRPYGSDMDANVYIHDLDSPDFATYTLMPDSFRTKHISWVQLNCLI
ncbi:WD40-repeat-containing domain-containing protein [Dioscorea alata]|uniref:WD40-repeat-containing domain-containing protein n=1 Tax=Dioscorea alata TaxID=55571 RepID=A0ACB7V8G8_DIOAL|nr:WD40-repeat-containing domain-containing protein [Dioscorea alata]